MDLGRAIVGMLEAVVLMEVADDDTPPLFSNQSPEIHSTPLTPPNSFSGACISLIVVMAACGTCLLLVGGLFAAGDRGDDYQNPWEYFIVSGSVLLGLAGCCSLLGRAGR